MNRVERPITKIAVTGALLFGFVSAVNAENNKKPSMFEFDGVNFKRSPRLDLSSLDSPNNPVPPQCCCDLAQVLGLITIVRNCCSNLTNLVTVDFNGTWTALGALNLGALCPPTVINPSDVLPNGYTITQPGNYQLCGSVGFDAPLTPTCIIRISSSNVVLDLNENTLYQVDADPALAGICIDADLSNILIRNGKIIGVTGTGINLGLNNRTIHIDSIISSDNNVGIDIITASDLIINACHFDHNIVTGAAIVADKVVINDSTFNDNGSGGIVAVNSNHWSVNNCQFNNNVTPSLIAGDAFGFFGATCTDFIFNHCQFNGNGSAGNAAASYGVLATASRGLQFSCSDFNYNGNHAGQNGVLAAGMVALVSENFQITDCNFIGNSCFNTAFAQTQGLSLQAVGAVVKNCRFNGNSSVAPTGFTAGFITLDPTTGVRCSDCIAQKNEVSALGTASGFRVVDTTFSNCYAAYNVSPGGDAIGFDIFGVANVVRDCQSYSNVGGLSGVGFRSNEEALASWYSGNTAFGNLTNYSAPISFVNVGVGAQPAAGSFDERAVDNLSIV